jgi:two-component system, response regulator RegA
MTKLLLCDDDESNRLTTSALLEDEGFEVELARSYAEGHAKLTAPGASYQLLIFDYELGDGFGSALAALARSRWPGARVLLLTGSDDVDSSNVDAVVQKGRGFEALLSVIRGARSG